MSFSYVTADGQRVEAPPAAILREPNGSYVWHDGHQMVPVTPISSNGDHDQHRHAALKIAPSKSDVRPISRPTSFTAAELMEMDFPEPRFAVPGIIAEGFTYIAGAPKLGKSWMMLGLGIAVATGGKALGKIPVEEGEVHYLALEDPPRRLQSRLRKLLKDESAPKGLHLHTEWDRFGEGGAEALKAWLTEHPSCRFVVVDVFARVRPRVSDRADRYLSDYESAQALKRLADEHSVAIAALHHTRKAGAEDFVDTVSGTHGLAAAADSIIVCKRARGQADATLHITGRDVEERELALRFVPEIGSWSLLGDATEWAVSETRRRVLSTLSLLSPLSPKQVSKELDISHDSAKQTLKRMADDGQIKANGGGTYSPLGDASDGSDIGTGGEHGR